MLLHVPDVLSREEAQAARAELEGAAWVDGRGTAGHLSQEVKRNGQLHYADPVSRRLGQLVLSRLERQPMFMSAALPHSILPPLFNRYGEGEHYGPHVDGAIRPVDGTAHRIRTDVSATLFLSEPESYDGGELVVQDTFGPRAVKLPAGHLVLYPGVSVHHVAPVSRGVRLAAFFWVQSLVRADADRALLFEMDAAIQQMPRETPAERALVTQFTNTYHNLLRRWSDL
ncbi:MAG: Fe2+-dependent dioxygenase [Caulobacteraceae bacterium]|nr:Fe2+-dependent dioxygenase [Caulobacter sp.]